MVKMILQIDTSDCAAVVAAIVDLSRSLPWPHGERFRREVDAICESGDLIVFEDGSRRGRGPTLTAFAAPALMDLIVKYRPFTENKV